MGKDGWGLLSPSAAPPNLQFQIEEEEHWSHFSDNSVNAISFCFIATAILISMFLIMAIFERFIRPRSTTQTSSGGPNLEAQMGFDGKLDYPSHKTSVYAKVASILMPGDDIPTFIAHPAPLPCPAEHVAWPSHQHNPYANFTSNLNSSTNLTFENEV